MSLAEYAANLFNIQLTAEHLRLLDIYTAELTDWNNRVNLTAITEPNAIEIRHFLDSLSLVMVLNIREAMRLIDVGTGAGFPGLPLAIVFPQVRVTLLESTGKKVDFLKHMIQKLGLTNADTMTARAEEAGQMSKQREKYDVVVARAVARLPALAEYLLPFARVGGLCIAMKGRTAYEEAEDAGMAVRALGGKLLDIVEVKLPDVEETHYLVMMEKIGPTPPRYPRSPGTPTRKPIM